MNFIDNFPLLVVEIIFLHLTKDKILESTLISPEANRIISKSRRLMRNYRFKISGRRTVPPTRKYSQIDFFDLNRQSTFEDLPVQLTQLTFDNCYIDVDVLHALLSRFSDTLELLIVNDCLLYGNGFYSGDNFEGKTGTELKPLHFQKLKTLILADMECRPRFILLSIIRAANLVELGMVNIISSYGRLERCAGKLFVELVNSNPKLKILNVPSLAAQMLIAYAEEHLEVEYCFEELHIGSKFNYFDQKVMEFLETQKNTLKYLRIEECAIKHQYSEKLLSMNLVRLEFHCCAITLLPNSNVENRSIESLSVIGCSDMSLVYSFVNCCKNISTCIALLDPEHAELLPWRYFDIDEMVPEDISWADLRSLRYAGVAITISFIKRYPNKQRYHFYIDESKDLTAQTHPNSVIKFKKR